MATLHVILPAREYTVPFAPGLTLREILQVSAMRLPSTCGGAGTCGLCRIRVRAGAVDAPTARELRHLSAHELDHGIRLACQLKPRQDLTIDVDHPLLETGWRPLSPTAYPPASPPADGSPLPSHPTLPFGIAIDLGTTRIRLTLWNLTERRRVAGRIGANPQACFGADVLSRLTAAVNSDQQAEQMAALVRQAIGEALKESAAEGGATLRQIGQLVVVGNTAMLALLTEKNYQALLRPDSWEEAIDCRPDQTRSWGEGWGLAPEAMIEVVQPLAGFVGSDLLAGLLATRLLHGEAGSLLIDFGTNSEIALWDGATLWATSAAGGPAFEGCGLRSGMPAEPGAIVNIRRPSTATVVTCTVLEGVEPQGICGSGLVDAIAYLRSAALLKKGGRLLESLRDSGFHPLPDRPEITVTQADIDIFQRAKAAVAAGVLCLLAKAGMGVQELRRLCVCGDFGRFLDIDNAQAIGLLPALPRQRVELSGNTALAGCETLLLAEGGAALRELRRKARVINLALVPDFEKQFIANLSLQPLALYREPLSSWPKEGGESPLRQEVGHGP